MPAACRSPSSRCKARLYTCDSRSRPVSAHIGTSAFDALATASCMVDRSIPTCSDRFPVLASCCGCAARPLHQPHQIEAIRAVAAWLRKFASGVFRYAFHRRQPPLAQQFALPRNSRRRIHRYGFHACPMNTSSRAAQSRPIVPRQAGVAHLGNARACVRSRMPQHRHHDGPDPLDGLPMARAAVAGSRGGALSDAA